MRRTSPTQRTRWSLLDGSPLVRSGRSAARRYGAAVAVTALAVALTWLLQPWLGGARLPLFYAAVTLSAWYGGFAPALVTTVLSLLALDVFFLEPSGPLLLTWGDFQRLVSFLLVALLISGLTAARDRAEAALRASEQRFRRTFEQAPVGVAQIGVDGRVEAINPAYCRLLGCSADELIGRRVEEWTHPADRGACRPATEHTAVECRYLRADGGIVWVQVTDAGVRDERGDRQFAVEIVEDVTERKRAAEELRLTAERFRLALASSPVAVFSQDRDLRYTWVDNPPAGLTVEQIIGATDDDLVPAEEAVVLTALKRGVLDSGRGVRQEIRTTVEDRTLFFDLIVEPLRDERGAVVGVTCAAVDLTEQRERERILQDFVAATSHDLKNPLTAIRGQAQLLSRRLDRDPSPDGNRIAAGLETIDQAAGRMVSLIGELVDVTRLRAGQPLELQRQPTDLVALVAQVVAEYQRTSDRHRLRIDAQIPTLVGEWDGERLERVLANLVANAIKYSPEGGTITLRVAPDGVAGWASVSVVDEGIGIPANDLPHVFERFRRGGNVGPVAGSGIGLAGARQIVDLHGGQISVASEEGRGSTFTVRLPLAPLAAQA